MILVASLTRVVRPTPRQASDRQRIMSNERILKQCLKLVCVLTQSCMRHLLKDQTMPLDDREGSVQVNVDVGNRSCLFLELHGIHGPGQLSE
jgi:hypothetical protein